LIERKSFSLSSLWFGGTIHEQKVAKGPYSFKTLVSDRNTQPINSSGVNILLRLILEILEGHDTYHGIKENKNVSQSTVAARERRREIQCSQESDCRRIML
jgi:hypothetical protein